MRVRRQQLCWRRWKISDVVLRLQLAFVGIGELLDARLESMDKAQMHTK